MRKVLGLVAVLLAGAVGAYGITTDSVELTVTPLFNVSVNISSTTNAFGSLSLGSSETICVGTIINDGTCDSSWEKAVSDSNNGWTAVANQPALANEFKLLAITTGTAVSPNYASGTMATACMDGDHTTAKLGAGTNGTFSALSEGCVAGGTSSSPTHKSGETRRLWVSLMMPLTLSGSAPSGAQTITLSVRAKL
jgi:hypothetical protein